MSTTPSHVKPFTPSTQFKPISIPDKLVSSNRIASNYIASIAICFGAMRQDHLALLGHS